MIVFLLFTILISFSIAAKKECNKHSSAHSKFYEINYNKTSTRFFVRETYNLSSDPCESMSNQKFRLLHKKYVLGQDVEHIIDTANSEPDLAKCDKNIRGNLILADHIWNTQIGQLCWDYVKAEKSIVYGTIFQKAMDNVRKCCKLTDDNNDNNDNDDSDDISGATVLSYLFMSAVILLVLMMVIACITMLCVCISRIIKSITPNKPVNSSDSDYDFQ